LNYIVFESELLLYELSGVLTDHSIPKLIT